MSLIFAPHQWRDISDQFVQMQAEAAPVGKLRSVIRRVFLPRAQLAVQYGADPTSWRVYFYYLARIKGLLQRYPLRSAPRSSGFEVYADLKSELMDWLGKS
jgi:hypothetical protein